MWNWLHTCSVYSEIIIWFIWKNEMWKKYSAKDAISDPLKPVDLKCFRTWILREATIQMAGIREGNTGVNRISVNDQSQWQYEG